MLDGLARDVVGDNPLFNMTRAMASPDAPQIDLAMNPFVFWLLSGRGHIVGLTAHGFLSVDSVGFSENDESEQTRYLAQTELKDERFGGVLKIPFFENPGTDGSRQEVLGAVLVISHDRSKVIALEDVFRAYGVVGFVKMHSETIEHGSAVVDSLMEAARRLLNQQIQRVASGALTEGEVYEEVVLYLLRYAGPHMQLSMTRGGSMEGRVVELVANHVFDLPLLNARHGSPVSVRRLFYAFRNVHFTNPGTNFEDLQWAGDLIALEEVSEPLKAWLLAHFHPDRVRRFAERQRASVVQDTSGRQVSRVMNHEQALLASITHWLQTLRPDSGFAAGGAGTEDLPMRLVLGEHPQMSSRRGAAAEALLALEMPTHWQSLERNAGDDSVFPGMSVWMNPNHWMTQWALASGPGESRPLAWLLLAAYAHINEVLEAVKNADEQVFQQRVYEALRAGTLTWVD